MGNNFYRWLVVIGIALWVTETAMFGFNETAQSGAEKVADFVATLLVLWGVVGDIFVDRKAPLASNTQLPRGVVILDDFALLRRRFRWYYLPKNLFEFRGPHFLHAARRLNFKKDFRRY